MVRIILFDGICNFCDSSVQFIIKRDPKGVFKFASLQSVTGQMLLKQVGLKEDINSFVLIEGEQYFLKSTAALRICRKLNGTWRLLSFLIVIPAPIRDYFYSILARNRYKWFGKKESCMLPSQEVRNRFLE